MNLSKVVLFLSCTLLAGQNPVPNEIRHNVGINEEFCSATNSVFATGERIVYKIFYNWGFVWIAAGEVVFTVSENQEQYHLAAAGRTYKSYDWVFKVRDYFDSYVDKETLRPERTIRQVLEGNYTLYDDVTFKHHQSVAISKKGKSIDKLSTDQISLNNCTHDILSSIYMMRNLDFTQKKEGTRLPMNIYLDRKIYSLDVVYAGKDETKRVKGLGKCKTLLFRPQLVVGNVFKDNDGMKIWVSDDDNRIPLMIESPISVGSVKVILSDYSGLKFPAEY
ncbi:MAG: DUF3108 domain-containing protein [Saprospiraceae bacterium]|nr:DUF3108 domain-containing protein [Saprospiraceae bacterium]